MEGQLPPTDILPELLQGTNITTILSARVASPQLQHIAAALVTTLHADTGSLPHRAFKIFRHATRILASGNGIMYLGNIRYLLYSLPPRIVDITIKRKATAIHGWPGIVCEDLAHKLLKAKCSSNLQRLVIEQPISTAAADTLLQQLPSLQSLSLAVYPGDVPRADARQRWTPATHKLWKPAAAASSHLSAFTIIHSQTINIDMAALSSTTTLKSLTLQHTGSYNTLHLHNTTTISRLQHLQHFRSSLTWDDMPWQHVLDMQVFSSLRELQTLDLEGADCSAAGWALLAGLPKLHSVMLRSIQLNLHSPPAPAVRSICKADMDCRLDVQLPAEQKRGCLARLLPNLETMDGVVAGTLQQLAWMLHGHQQLRVLHVKRSPSAAEEWAVRLLRKLPALEEIRVTCWKGDVDDVLDDLSGCSKLRVVRVCPLSYAGLVVTAAGLSALATGPCQQSLEELDLLGGIMLGLDLVVESVAALAELLKGGMVRLTKVAVAVRAPAGIADLRGWLAAELRAAGAVVGYRVAKLECLRGWLELGTMAVRPGVIADPLPAPWEVVGYGHRAPELEFVRSTPDVGGADVSNDAVQVVLEIV